MNSLRDGDITTQCNHAREAGIPGIPGANAKTPQGRQMLAEARAVGLMPQGGDPTRMYPASNGVREGTSRMTDSDGTD